MHSAAEILSAIERETDVAPLLPATYIETPPHRFDFSKDNPDIQAVDVMSADPLNAYVRDTLRKVGRSWGLGGYGEDRLFYRSSELFRKEKEYRTVHLGIDIWLPSGTPLYAPLGGVIRGAQDNPHFLDYGPTIIIEHDIGGIRFFSLYGHLGRESIHGREEGERIASGEQLGVIGETFENGGWAPHLHLQLMNDLLGNVGDFPGTATPSEKMFYLQHCPNPEILFLRFLK
ncbi:hypothetical protein A3B35_01600 [Candidatus Kaiserbacteria bacterium RIFCSPLOWO2_01_FULL_54_24]|uniref:M23ase beta-sheet core domain-containing protein n=1 Tax=Candidatus Kaiserbacteria bacterium RIFCSPLOWO2_01_FULL_54_24 TaxID=1798515 RepID=A0A1F6ESY4_9BACT|nr:MAG: hypothetical protein A3B35_01600 [Candidatus Kaiserbacteria bacterium RIFCSPLOWO2_01_FULL_54_24]